MNKSPPGWPEKRKYNPYLKRSVAPRHRIAALKSRRNKDWRKEAEKKRRKAELAELKRYKPRPKKEEKVVVNWSYDTTNPMIDRALNNREQDTNYAFSYENMSPQKYINLQKYIIGEHYKNRYDPEQIFWSGINRQYVEVLKSDIKNGKPVNAFYVEFDKNNNLINSNSDRHRIIALKELGVKKVPVWYCKRKF